MPVPIDDKPIIFLDVDGVINMFPGTPADDMMVGDARPEPHDRAYRITWWPSILERLKMIHKDGRAYVCWLTTWGSGANGELRELVGLPELPVAAESPQISNYTGWASSFSRGHGWWKFEAVREIVEQHPDRKYVWLDDDLSLEREAFEYAQQSGILAISPQQWEGLTHEHLNKIETFLAE